MPGKFTRWLLAVMLILAAVEARLTAETPVEPNAAYTEIKVSDMHCLTCAKKIAGQLYVVPGVVRVHADVEKNTAYVVPQKTKAPSPRAMWDAVEKAGFKPVSLTGPAGKFTKRPNS